MDALDTFRHPVYRHNCAQAVANKWCHLFAEKQMIVDKYAPLVGGKAPGGYCGALYAAMQAAPAHAEDIRCEFINKIGAERCHEIKAMAKAPCTLCVATADALLEKYCR